MRGRVGYLGHEPLLYRDLTARENLTFHARLHGVDAGAGRRAARRGAARAPRRRARVATSRAAWSSASPSRARVLHDPPLLLLDEPRANLDPAAAELLEPLIGRASGRTRVLVTHDVEGGLAESDVVARACKRGRAGVRRHGRPSPPCGSCTRDPRGGRDPPQGPAHRAAHAPVGAGDGAVQRHRVRAVPLRARPRPARRRRSPSGVLWVTLLLATVLAVNRLFAHEREQGGLDGLLLAPIDRTGDLRRQGDRALPLPGRCSS